MKSIAEKNKNKLMIISSSLHFIDVFFKDFVNYISCSYNVCILTNTKLLKIDTFNSKFFYIPIKRKISFISDIITIFVCIYRFILIKPKYLISVTPKSIIFGSILKFIFVKIHRTHIYTGITWTNMRGYQKYFFIFLDKINIYFSDLILFDSKEQIEFFKINNLASSKFHLINKGSIKGVDTNLFYKFDNKLKINLRKKFKIEHNSKVILYMGRMDVDKGVKDLIESFKSIFPLKKNLILLLVGRDEMNIKSYLKNFNSEIKNNIIYLDHTDNPSEIFNIANIFCLPSKREGFGNSIIESSACEVPVVGSDIFGLKSSLIDNYNGLTFKANDIQDLSFKLISLIDDRYLCNKLGKNGRKYVELNFKKNEVLRSLTKIITNNYV